MKPSSASILTQIGAEIGVQEQRLEQLRDVYGRLKELYSAPPEAKPRATRAAAETTKRQVRRRATRRTPIAPGSLEDRIIEVLTEFAAPMKKRPLIEAVKARPDDVTAAIKALRKADRVVLTGASRGAAYAVPKFAHVLVAETD